MAQYTNLITTIEAYIHTNGVQAITGAILQNVLKDVVDSLGKEYQFAGVVTPADTFTPGDENIAFIGAAPGAYENHGGAIVAAGQLGVMLYDGTWHTWVLDIATSSAIAAALGYTPANEQDIPDVSQFITKSVNDLVNYYLKEDTYTKQEVNALLGAIQQFHYEIYASLNLITDPASNVLYLIGPSGLGADKYEEYVYSGGSFVKIGDTSIDLSGYVTTQALNTALLQYTTTANLAAVALSNSYTDLNDKPFIPTALADLTEDATHRVVTDTEKQSWNGKYVKPQGGIPKADLAQEVTNSLNLADSAYQKPQGGIPARDLAAGVIPDVSQFITRNVNDLVNYYTKTQTYTKTEVQNLILAIQQFHYEIYASLADITDPAGNVLYLIGPTGSGADKYEEYVYANNTFTKIGDTSIDLSDYVTYTALNTALSAKQDVLTFDDVPTQNSNNPVKSGGVWRAVQDAAGTGEMNKIDTIEVNGTPLVPDTNKMVNILVPTELADLLEDATHRVVTDTEKATWNAKQDALPFDQAPTQNSGNPVTSGGIWTAIKDFITKSVSDLVNYYTKSETYTQTEVNNLLGSLNQFKYEIYATLADITTPASNVLYLIGPTGSGSDRYEEYVYSNGNFVKIGDTSVDLSGYVTTAALNTALAAYTATADLAAVALSNDYGDLDNKPTIPQPKIYVGTCPTGASTAIKVVTTEAFPVDANNKPLVGTMIAVKFSSSNTATAPKLNVNGLGAESIYYNNSVATSTSNIYGGGANRYTYYFWDGTYWVWFSQSTDNNDNTIGYTIRTSAQRLPVATACYRYRLLFTSADGTKRVPANSSNSTDGTAIRSVTTEKIDPFGAILYYSYTTALSAGTQPSASYQMQQYAGIVLGYSFNRTGAALNLTAMTPVYVKATPQADGSAIIDPDTPYVQALPTTNDGKIYIFLGIATEATKFELMLNHPVYYHDGTSLRLWTNQQPAPQVPVTDVEVNGVSVVNAQGVAEIPAIPSVPVQDVQVGGASVLNQQGVAEIPAIPQISTDIATDKASNVKAGGAKAIYDAINPAVQSSQPAGGFAPNTPYHLGTLTGSVTFALAAASDANIENWWMWTFDTGATLPTIQWPSGITWEGGIIAPPIAGAHHYEIYIMDGYGCYKEF